MSATIPAPVSAYFSAVNAGKAEGVASAFAPDGEVQDERATHRGRESISTWAADTLQRYRVQNAILSARSDASGEAVVIARVTGTFPGSPLDFTYRFTLDDGLVRVLEISL
ncbi:MAG TPA: nuclear transport factor 2 family protein [Brevundimonas sp.]|jgi:hypothetical protein|uniref:nuclear transport factor 2 family protein n=1 Tax=Brevundimonas sp. TaxID=1871086 RepID=UPI002E1276A6|nr:nuclear transport factor 2 family protein [Brevundimonas sp.]